VADRTAQSWSDRLTVIAAVAFSTAWTGMAVLYVRGLPAGLFGLTPAEAAGFLAGAAGPLAAVWLCVLVLEQRRRLGRLTHTIGEMLSQHRHGLQLMDSQTRALLSAQQDSAQRHRADARGLVLQDMAANVATLAERLGVLRREDVDMAWARYGSGDISAFVHPFLTFAASHSDFTERLAEAAARDPIAATALHGYVRRFERLTDGTQDELVRDILEEGALGRAYRLFKVADTASASAAADRDAALAARLTELSERLDASAPP
jgi:hypothetical protein